MSENQMKSAIKESGLEQRPVRVLSVDDEELNLEILDRHLTRAGYQNHSAENGKIAWAYLQEHGDDVDIILLDKMMPEMDGFEVLKRIKADPKLKSKPVIMQTAAIDKEDAIMGIELGAYYYVTKPYAAEMLISIVNSAAKDYRQQSEYVNEVDQLESAKSLITGGKYSVKTIEDARAVAAHIAAIHPEPAKVIVGIMGLLLNAVEHGSYGLGYEGKADALAEKAYEQTIKELASKPENAEKAVDVSFEKDAQYLTVNIKDCGEGFDWNQYINFEPSRMTDPNGRGIALANIVSPGGLSYEEPGNACVYRIPLVITQVACVKWLFLL